VEALIRERGAVPRFWGTMTILLDLPLGQRGGRARIPGDRVCKRGYHRVDVEPTSMVPWGFRPDLHGGKGVGGGPRLLAATQEALMAGIGAARAGVRLGEISMPSRAARSETASRWCATWSATASAQAAENRRFRTMARDSGPLLREGMVLAIEPMVNQGGWEVRTLPDNWTVVTRTETSRPISSTR